MDIYKALAIILVVIGHSNSPINGYIYTFHIAAFFFISGYTSNLQTETTKRYLYKKIRTLLVPYFSINIFYYLLVFVLGMFSLGKLFYPTPIDFFLQIKMLFSHLQTADIGGATWFLIVLFEVSVFAKILYSLVKRLSLKPLVMLLVSLLALVYAYSLYNKGIYYPYLLDLTLNALFYYVLGFFCKQNNVIEGKIDMKYALPLAICSTFFFTNIIFAGVNWPTRYFSSLVFDVIASLSGAYILYCLSVAFQKMYFLKKILIYVGQRTLAIFIFHFFVFRFIFALFYLMGICEVNQLSSLVPLNSQHWILITVLSIMTALLLEFIVSKSSYLAFFFFGKNKKYFSRNE